MPRGEYALHQVLLDFLDRLPELDSEASVGAALLELFKALGADGGNIWFAAGEINNDAINSITDYPEEYLDAQYNSEHTDHQAIPRMVATTAKPIRYGWEMDERRFGPDSADYKLACVARDLMGLRNALIIPIPTVGTAGSSGVSFYSTADADAFDKLVTDSWLVFAYAAQAAHLRMQDLRVEAARPAVALSARERECLLWTARGLRVKEIAHRLNLRDVTIELHLKNARRKLAAQTVAEAVVKAVMARVIAP